MATKSPIRRRPRARTLDARPDTLDFRGRIYVPTPVDVPRPAPDQTYAPYSTP